MIMVQLQMLDRYDTFAIYDPASGVLQEFKRKASWRKAPANPHGVYSHLLDQFLAFYGINGKFYLALGTRIMEIGIEETIEVSGPRHARTLRVLNRHGETLGEVDYCLDGIPGPIPNDPTPFIEDEDRDIGLLVSNISKDVERRNLLING